MAERELRCRHSAQAEKITQPAPYMAGEYDPVPRFVPGRRLSDLMDPSSVDLSVKKTEPGVGHWIQQEAPEAVNRELLAFLNGL